MNQLSRKSGTIEGLVPFPPEKKVSLLKNSIYYFLQGVLIIQEKEGFRLLVIQHGKLLDDELYRTVRGARIAFAKRYKYKLWAKNTGPRWTPFR